MMLKFQWEDVFWCHLIHDGEGKITMKLYYLSFIFAVSVEGANRFRLSYVDLLKDSKRNENLETLG